MSRRRHRGNVALGAALLLVPLALLGGIGIDFGRAYVAQSQLSQAVDAGALAGARVLGLRDPGADARMYFDANLRIGEDQLTLDQFSAVAAADNRTLDVRARGRLETTFLKLAGPSWRTLPIAARATARRTTMGMELALVLDVTGSMLGNGGMAQLRPAALDLLSIVFGAQAESDNLYVSIVPYTHTVNVGHTNRDWLTPGSIPIDPDTNEQIPYRPFRWRGCVEARADGEDQTDTPPTVRPFTPFLYASTRARTAAGEFGYRTGTEPRFGDNDWGVAPAIASSERPDADESDSLDPALMYTPANERKGPNVGCGQPIMGLTNNRAALEGAIRGLQASHRGGTMGNMGLQWGWFTLSPRWRGRFGTSMYGTTTPPGMPLDYPGPRSFMKKVMVMMTDGENNWFDYGRPPGPDYTGYGRLTEGRLGTTNAGTANTRLNERMATMCTRIKGAGITLYTITLGTGGGTRALYEQCATSPAYYCHAPTSARLRVCFREIGGQLANLRLER